MHLSEQQLRSDLREINSELFSKLRWARFVLESLSTLLEG
jgi:hypothetical protein